MACPIRLRAVQCAKAPDERDTPYLIRANSCFCETRHPKFRFFDIPELAFATMKGIPTHANPIS